MKLATFLHQGRESFGLVMGDGICDVPALACPRPASLLEALQGGPETIRKIGSLAQTAKARIPLNQVELLPPIPNPPKVLGLAGNYVQHLKESNLAKGLSDSPATDTTPRPFLMPATAITGPNREIPWPVCSRQIDYEIELAVVMGASCKCVPPREAQRYIAGYTIANDVSARSATFAEGRSRRPWDEFYDWLNGKWADGFCPIGPWMVTADEVGDPTKLELELKVNGRTRQKESTANMIFNVYEVVSFISHIMTLTAGDIIATGTPSGVGMGTGDYLKGGDVITCRIERIGELTNTMGKPPESFYTPCA